MSIEVQIRSILGAYNKHKVEVTNEDNLVEALDLDSLDVVELIMNLEDDFGIEISEADVETLVTLNDMVDYISKKTS